MAETSPPSWPGSRTSGSVARTRTMSPVMPATSSSVRSRPNRKVSISVSHVPEPGAGPRAHRAALHPVGAVGRTAVLVDVPGPVDRRRRRCSAARRGGRRRCTPRTRCRARTSRPRCTGGPSAASRGAWGPTVASCPVPEIARGRGVSPSGRGGARSSVSAVDLRDLRYLRGGTTPRHLRRVLTGASSRPPAGSGSSSSSTSTGRRRPPATLWVSASG